ncbi:hypothetical protein ILUMI_14247 [Ignelater luminosus]|uniref:Uncharacterized protein n=1 Tax=Ignelater luminosus TaxID=2038154 RepID=A0A8K0CV82_IGNLU|nr:hypothetical protein ILUMI_14247 [Ignelater luminosus]
MHDLYVTKMQEFGQDKLHNRCGLCEEVQLLKNEAKLSDEKQTSYKSHILEKTLMRKERQKDRADNHKAVLCFDLQNVLQFSKAEISQFYYKTKFSVYNLTAHFSINEKVYCAFWAESTMGLREINIASALSEIIEGVLGDNPEVTKLTTWSDSCVLQNKNTILSFAVGRIIANHPEL